MNFQAITDYFRTGKASAVLVAILRTPLKVFDFAYERGNRMRRFVLVTRDYAQGIPVDKIAEKYKCSRSTVLRHARIAGLAKRDKSPVPGRKEGILADYIAGKPIAEIANAHGVAQSRVSQIAADAGISRRKKA